MNFTTKLDDSRNISLYNFDAHSIPTSVEFTEHEIENEVFIIDWTLDMDVREWGIRGVDWYLENVQGEFDVMFYDDNGNEKGEEHITFDFAEFKGNVSFDIEFDAGIHITDIDIDFKAKTITIS